MNVYTPVEQIRIPSSHGDDVNYLVCYGYVDWKRDGNLRETVYILIEYKGKVSYNLPAHMITEKDENGQSDFHKVLGAINQLKSKYNL